VTVSYRMRNRVLLALGYRDYKQYLQSDLWKSIRVKVLRVHRMCAVCISRPSTLVHHTSYARTVLLGTNLRPLYGVCHPCHERIEFDDDGNKLTAMQALLKFRELVSKRKVRFANIGRGFVPKKFVRRKGRRR
jgi:hypothetical protein